MSGSETERFNMLLQQGCDYTIRDGRFQVKLHIEFRNIQSNYECRLDRLTIVEPWNIPIQFPVYSNHLTSIHEVMHCPSKTYIGIFFKSKLFYFVFNNTHCTNTCSIYTDIAGIVVPWGQIERPRSGLCREIVLMYTR